MNNRLIIKFFNSLLILVVLIFGTISPVFASSGGIGGGGGSAGGNGGTGLSGGAAAGGSAAGGGGGGGGGGSAAGGAGGNGAGGSLLLKNTSGTMSITGTIDSRGGSSSATNGGTVKLFYTGISPSTSGVSSGRTFTSALSGSNTAPNTPTLLAPASGATGISTSPLLQLKTNDSDGDYLQYKILLYNSDCSTGLQTFDQTSSQVGWSGQDANSNTAYVGSSILSASTVATFGNASLSTTTTYCWKAAAIDPGGTNTFSAYSPTQLFTTGSASGQVQINGGVLIRGGTLVR
jgi:hypothetical protein